MSTNTINYGNTDTEPPRRFNKLSHNEAILDAECRDKWLIDEVVNSASTLIYGEAKSGKSMLVSALIGSLLSGDDFLGRQVPSGTAFSVAVCWTDDDGAADYATQIQSAVPDGTELAVEYYMLPNMRAADWQMLFDDVIADGHNLVVIDNLTQCLDGSINQDDVVRVFFNGVRLFTRAGIPVVIIGHSTEKAGLNNRKSDKPMGSSVVSQSVRWLCFVRRYKNGKISLKFSGNHAKSHEITVMHGDGARFDVLKTTDATEMAEVAEQHSQKRKAETYDRNRQMAEWVVNHCQGCSSNTAARKLSEESPFDVKRETARSRLKAGGPVGRQLRRSDSPSGRTSWSLVER